MSKNLEVVINYPASRQYYVIVNNFVYKELNLKEDDYVLINFGTKRLVTKCQYDSDIKQDKIALHSRTHCRTLGVATSDRVTIKKYKDVINKEPISIVAKSIKNKSLIKSPIIDPGLSLYVEPGYTISCKQGFCIVEHGTGIYKFDGNVYQSENLGVMSSYSVGKNNNDPMMDFTDENESTSININFCNMGIGGLQEQMSSLIKEVLISRIIPEKMRKDYDVKDEKGILLYGPPGTGKTLIAKNIGKIIPNTVIRKINGPELINKFYGESEKNVRDIFDEAKKNPNKLHIIIFDEIDSIGRMRGQGSSNHDDRVLTQLLTMIDGLDSTNNVFIIGITNRKDVLDTALIRPGRLGFHVEIPLPTESGRKEILDIYIDPLKKNNLAEEIDTNYLAKLLEGCSGSDINSLISRAKNLALLRNCKIEENSIEADKNAVYSKVTQSDITNAFDTFQPTFSKNDDYVKKYVANYPVSDYDTIKEIVSKFESYYADNDQIMIKPYLIRKTSFNKTSSLDSLFQNSTINEEIRASACHLALMLDFPYVKYLSYNEFLGKNSCENCGIINNAYINCLQAESSILILDSLSDVGDRALNLKENFIINNPLEQGKKLIIIQLSS